MNRWTERLWEYDCLVLPTFHPGEGYPGVIAEAFVHEIPVITTIGWRYPKSWTMNAEFSSNPRTHRRLSRQSPRCMPNRSAGSG